MTQLLYVSKGTWFMKDTIAVLMDDYNPMMNGGLFLGTRVCQNSKSENRPLGEVYLDEEVCNFDEFEEIDNVLGANCKLIK